jgi:hypothetical protein
VRFLLPALLVAACSRPPAETAQPRGLQLEGVRLTTWRDGELGSSGTAARATLTAQGFFAEDVALTTSTGVTLRAPLVDGSMDLRRLAASDGAAVKTDDGCSGSTRSRVEYFEGIARTEGPVSGGGCGFTVDGSRLEYNVLERRAEISGPVKTRIEAAP